ncbi:MAG: hypothetical protein JWQ02_903, partial [Capsulimonas sp.]|nr:hypothetical protein [Capsulimonas sp.]
MNDRAKRRSPKRSVAMIMTVVVVGAFAGVIGFLWRLERDPVVNIPVHTVPSPNAFDDYARAGKLLQDARTVSAPVRRGTSRVAHLPPAVQDRILRDNAPALAAIRVGLAHPYATPSKGMAATKFDYLMTDRSLVRLLAFQADVQAARGKWADSAQTSLDALQMSEDIPRGGGSLPLVVGASLGATARDPLLRAVPHLDLVGAKAALRRIHKINSEGQPYSQTVQEDKYSGQASLMEIFQKPDWRKKILQESLWVGGAGKDVESRVRSALTSKQDLMNSYTKFMDGMVADAEAHRLQKNFNYFMFDP